LVAYGLFCWPLYVFSTAPGYHYLQPDEAEMKLAFQHAGQHVQECHKRTPEELQKLPPNMRKLTECSRERSPLTITLQLDGAMIAQRVFLPSGMHRDGMTFVYARFAIPAGSHRIAITMQDDVRHPDTLHQKAVEMTLVPGQVVMVGFNGETGGFWLSGS
jgi:hypothetical protein